MSGIHQESKTGETRVEDNLIYYEETHNTLAPFITHGHGGINRSISKGIHAITSPS